MIPTKTISSAGRESWRLPNGKLHREDGPAVIWADGTNWWILLGEDLPFSDYCEELKQNYGKADEDIMMIRMQYTDH